MHRRRNAPPDEGFAHAYGAFRQTITHVEEARRTLAAAAPRGRSAGVPLAEALAGFDEEIAAAREAMGGWRVGFVEAEWLACQGALVEAARRAEALRLGAAPQGYEQLYGTLADLMEPLEAFDAAFERFRSGR